MNAHIVQIGAGDRASLVRRGRRLEYFTIAYNSLEGLVVVVAGLMAGSIALVGFGFDSLIEVTSGVGPCFGDYIPTRTSRGANVSWQLLSGLSVRVFCCWPRMSVTTQSNR